ncbi:MAG: tetratricopeptide repeat protein [Sedimentisphaerales bacterium]|nr:tetratricopeptide repeat protein [Sedimentisphaerales bacterium]
MAKRIIIFSSFPLCIILAAVAVVFVGIGRGQQANIQSAKTQALSFIESRKWSQAEAAVNKLITDFAGTTETADAIYEIAESYEIASRFEEAERHYGHIFSNSPETLSADRSDLGIERVKVLDLIETKDFNSAGIAFDKLNADFKGHPDMAFTLYWVAERYERQSRFEEAKEVYQQAINDFPDDLYANKSQMGSARAEVKRLIMSQKFEQAKEALDEFINDFADNPDLAESLYWITERLKRFDRFEEAKRYYEQIVEDFPDTVWAEKSRFCIARADVMIHFMAQDYNEANEAIDKLIADFNDNPDLPEALYWLTERFERMSRFEEAKNYYQYIADNYPESTYAGYAKLGVSTIDVISVIYAGDYNEADIALDKLIEDYNGSPRLAHCVFVIGEQYYNLATGQGLAQGKEDESKKEEHFERTIAVLDRIINELPPFGEELAEAHFFTGSSYFELGNYNKAIEHLEITMALYPDYRFGWSAYNLIGECYQQLLYLKIVSKEVAEPLMEQAYQSVIEKYPKSCLAGHCQIKLGEFYLDMGRFDDAIEYFESFLDNADKWENHVRLPYVLYRLGSAYQEAGDLESAKVTFEMLLEKVPPDHKWTNAIKKRIEDIKKIQNGSTGSL